MVAEMTVEKPKGRVTGEVIEPGDEAYDEARSVLNAMIDRRPRDRAPAAQRTPPPRSTLPETTGSTSPFAGGAHSVPGFGTVDDGVVIDLSRLNTVTVDPDARTARAGGGTTWGVFNDATRAHGLATTGGIISTTGVGGLTLGGGIGYLARGLRAVVRQPGLGAGRHRRRAHRDGERARERGSLLGAPRRRRQLRRRHRARVPAAPGSRRSTAGRCSSRSSTRATCCASTASSSRTRRGVRRVPRVADRTAAPVHPGGAPRRAVPRDRRLLGGRRRRGRERDPA